MTCVIYDFIDCVTPSPEPQELLDVMHIAAKRLGVTALGELSVRFQPHGITCVLVLAESHLIVSTWPEHKLAHIDLFTCRADTNPEHALEPIIDALGSTKSTQPIHQSRHAIFPPSSSALTTVARLFMRVYLPGGYTIRWRRGNAAAYVFADREASDGDSAVGVIDTIPVSKTGWTTRLIVRFEGEDHTVSIRRHLVRVNPR